MSRKIKTSLTQKQADKLIMDAHKEVESYSFLRFGQAVYNILREDYPTVAENNPEFDTFEDCDKKSVICEVYSKLLGNV